MAGDPCALSTGCQHGPLQEYYCSTRCAAYPHAAAPEPVWKPRVPVAEQFGEIARRLKEIKSA